MVQGLIWDVVDSAADQSNLYHTSCREQVGELVLDIVKVSHRREEKKVDAARWTLVLNRSRWHTAMHACSCLLIRHFSSFHAPNEYHCPNCRWLLMRRCHKVYKKRVRPSLLRCKPGGCQASS